MMRGRDAEAYDRFRLGVEVPMLVASLAIIPLLGAPLVLDLSPGVAQTLTGLGWAIWALFVVEYLTWTYPGLTDT